MADKSIYYILWGSAGHAKVLAEIIRMKGGRIVALFDNNPETLSCLPGVPLYHGTVGLQDWLKKQESLEGMSAAIAIGGAKGKERQQLAKVLRYIGLSLPCVIHPSAIVSDSANLGEGCQILAQAVVAADVSIGRLCIVNNCANIDHESQLGSGVHIAPGAVLCGCVSIDDNTMIGAGAVVLPRVSIGKDVLVGAGSIVTRDVPDGVVVVGNPAKIIRNSR